MHGCLVAHGEGWDMTTSHMVNRLVHEALEEHARKMERLAETVVPVEDKPLARGRETIAHKSNEYEMKNPSEDEQRPNIYPNQVSPF